jgi:hypothetical protein
MNKTKKYKNSIRNSRNSKNSRNKTNSKNSRNKTNSKSKKQYGGLSLLPIEQVKNLGFSTINRLTFFLLNSVVTKTLKNSVSLVITVLTSLLLKMNDVLLTDEAKRDFSVLVQKLSIFSNIFLDAMEEPLRKSMGLFTNLGIEFFEGLSAGALKVLFSTIGAVPFIGAIIDMGNAINGVTEIIKKSTNIAGKVVETFNTVIDETKAKIDNTLHLGNELNITNKLNQGLSKVSDGITKRTSNSINDHLASLPLPPN